MIVDFFNLQIQLNNSTPTENQLWICDIRSEAESLLFSHTKTVFLSRSVGSLKAFLRPLDQELNSQKAQAEAESQLQRN